MQNARRLAAAVQPVLESLESRRLLAAQLNLGLEHLTTTDVIGAPRMDYHAGHGVMAYMKMDPLDGNQWAGYVDRLGANATPTGSTIKAAAHVDNVAIASADDGSFVVVWESHDNHSILAQRYDSSGNTVGSQLTVAANGSSPAVTYTDDGAITICYFSGGNLTGQIYDTTNNALGAPFLSTAHETVPLELHRNNLGQFILATDTTSGGDISVWRFEANGAPIRQRTDLNFVGATRVDVAMGDDGAFILGLDATSSTPGYGRDVYFLRYNAKGINFASVAYPQSTHAGDQGAGRIAINRDGSFALTWADGPTTKARFYDANGKAISDETILAGARFPGEITFVDDRTIAVAYSHGDAQAFAGDIAVRNASLNEDVFTVTGTSSSDWIDITDSNGALRVTMNGIIKDYAVNFGKLRLLGLEGNDTLKIGSLPPGVLSVSIDGGAGNDFIRATDTNDEISGGGGNDTLDGGLGNDMFSGGSGIDMVAYDTRRGSVVIHLDGITPSGQTGEADVISKTVENAIGTVFDDLIIGNELSNTLNGHRGNDTIYANGGNDLLIGNDGNDRLYAGIGNDSITGDNGNDTIYGEDGADVIDAGIGKDRVWAGIGEDAIHGGADNDALYGDDERDTIWGDAGDDTLDGCGGNDSLFGGDGNDSLYGHGGNDVLRGDGGTNHLEGGVGTDYAYKTKLDELLTVEAVINV
jgi:Ca2+-binding RTX toxin-like protein